MIEREKEKEMTPAVRKERYLKMQDFRRTQEMKKENEAKTR